MTIQSFALLALFLAVLLVLAWPLGVLLARVADGGTIRGFGAGLEPRYIVGAGTLDQ